MKKPKISVLIPAYNHGKYLKGTIGSVLNQTFTDFELLICDDYSTDNSAEVINSFADNRIKAVFSKENRGTVRSLNKLLNLAQGEYIAVLGSDDEWYPEKLEKQLSILENNSDIAASFSYADIVDANGDIITNASDFPLDIYNIKNADKAFLLKQFFQEGNRLCHSSVLIRTSVHKEIGEYSVKYRQLHDLDLWIRLLLKYQIHITEEPLVKYRYISNSGNVSQNTLNNSVRLMNEAEELFLYLFKNISDADFIKVFNKNLEITPERIICEKFLILKNANFWNSKSTTLAVNYLFKNLNDSVLECFEKDYNISLNELYSETAVLKTSYNAEIYARSDFYSKVNKTKRWLDYIDLKKKIKKMFKKV